MVGCVIAPDTIHIWNAQTGNAIGEPVKVPASRITSIGFSLDGTKLVSESIDNVTHSIRIWDIERAVPVRELHRPMESVRSFFCSPDCTRVIVTHEQGGGIEIWNVVEGSMVGNVQGGACWIKSVEISPDGSRMVVVPSEGEIQLWDVPGRSLVKIFSINANILTPFTVDVVGNFLTRWKQDCLRVFWSGGGSSLYS